MATINEQILSKLQSELLTASSAGTITHGDASITYRSYDELLRLIRYYEGQVATESVTGAGRIKAVNKGRGRYIS